MNCDLIPERNHPIGTIGYLISTVIVVIIIIVVINNRDDDGQRESDRERCKTFYATPPPATACRAGQQRKRDRSIGVITNHFQGSP